MKDEQENKKVRVACYIAYQNRSWIKAAQESEAAIDGKYACRFVNDILDEYAVGMRIEKEGIYYDDELVLGTLCRLCGEVPEGRMHITSGCKMLASREYMTRHNNLLKILMVAWCNENKLMERDEAW